MRQILVQVLSMAFILSSASLVAQVPASLVMDLAEFRWYAAMAGELLPSTSYPYSATTVLSVLDSIENDSRYGEDFFLPEQVSSLRERDIPLVDIAWDTTYENYFRPNHFLSFPEMLEKVDPLATLTLSYQFDFSTVLFVRAVLQREYAISDLPSNLFGSLMPGNPIALENNLLRESYLYMHHAPFEVIIGRQDLQIGPSPLTSIMVSPLVPYLDAINMRAALGPLKMTWIVSTLENKAASYDVTVPPPYAFGTTVILHNIHYFEYSFDILRIGIGGQVLITRPGNAFQVADFFPVFSWHNANIDPNNLTLTMDATFMPIRGLELYSQFGFDDINTNGIGSNDATIPTIHAGLAGVSWNGLFSGFRINGASEVGYTHYLWGSYEDTIPLARAIYRMESDGRPQLMALNSPFGPGTAWTLLRVECRTPWNIYVRSTTRLLWQKPNVDLVSTPYAADPAIEAQPSVFSMLFNLFLRYDPLPWLNFTLEPEVFVEGGEAWLELSISANIHVSAQGRALRQTD